MYEKYWNTVWNTADIEEYRNYIAGYNQLQNDMVAVFRANGVYKVCDAACGFGANSLVLHSNGFQVYGFDIADASVKITTALLTEYGLHENRFKKASMMDTGYSDHEFDAVAARAVLDHLSCADLQKALCELKRITKENGLVYASFDPLEDDDAALAHEITEDGSFIYTDPSRAGLLFHFYSDDEIKRLFRKEKLLSFQTDPHGNRHIILQL